MVRDIDEYHKKTSAQYVASQRHTMQVPECVIHIVEHTYTTLTGELGAVYGHAGDNDRV
jgi:hypothetical protein